MLSILLYENGLRTDATLAEVPQALSGGAVVWADVSGRDLDGLLEVQKTFDLHDLAIETCTDELSRPGMVDYDTHTFMVLNPLVGFDSDEPKVEEMDLFLGERFLITVHREPVATLAEVMRHCRETPPTLARGADFIFYMLMDHLTDHYFEMLEQFDDKVDELEDRLVSDPSQRVLNQVFLFKRQLVQFRRIIGPQREVCSMLNNREFPYIQRQTLVYFRDVYEHLIRLYEMVDSLRDLLSGFLDAYLSTVSNRMSEVMKTLTVIATIFMPLTMLSSIYGMNFKHMPELEWRYGYFALLTFMVCVAVGMVSWFKRRKWI